MVCFGFDINWICKGVDVMNQEEIMESTEILEEETMETYEEVVVDNSATTELLTNIYNDVHIIMVFTIITFVTACFRGWRKNVVKGVH